MEKPNISPNFTVEDIHKIREYNYEMTKDMTQEERWAYYAKKAEVGYKKIEAIRARKASTAV